MRSWAMNPSNQSENMLQVWHAHLLGTSEEKKIIQLIRWVMSRTPRTVQLEQQEGGYIKIRCFNIPHVTIFDGISQNISRVTLPQSEFRVTSSQSTQLKIHEWARVRWVFVGPKRIHQHLWCRFVRMVGAVSQPPSLALNPIVVALLQQLATEHGRHPPFPMGNKDPKV